MKSFSPSRISTRTRPSWRTPTLPGFVKKGVKDKTALDKLYDKRRNQEANQNDNEVDELDDDGDDGDLGDDDDGLLDDILAYEQEGQGNQQPQYVPPALRKAYPYM